MTIFVISLADASDRRAFISKELGGLGLDFEFLDAVRGKDFHEDPELYDRDKALRIELRDMTPGELGCALSHQKAYDAIRERGLPYALVMEDDAMLSPDLPEALRLLEGRIRPNDLIQLERCDVYSHKGVEPLYKDYRIVVPRMVKYGSMCQSAGYVITREAAEKIRTINRPVFIPADSWGQYRHIINFRGIVPTLTLVKQNVSFECTTQDFQRSENSPSTPIGLLVYAFKTRSAIGRWMVRSAKKILRWEAK
jgi:glycosyl transferase, family 25